MGSTPCSHSRSATMKSKKEHHSLNRTKWVKRSLTTGSFHSQQKKYFTISHTKGDFHGVRPALLPACLQSTRVDVSKLRNLAQLWRPLAKNWTDNFFLNFHHGCGLLRAIRRCKEKWGSMSWFGSCVKKMGSTWAKNH